MRSEVLLRLLCKVEPISNVCEFLPTSWPASERVPLRTSHICHVPLLETVQPTTCLEDLDGHTCIFVLGISFGQPPSSNNGGTVAGGANDCSQPYETNRCPLCVINSQLFGLELTSCVATRIVAAQRRRLKGRDKWMLMQCIRRLGAQCCSR